MNAFELFGTIAVNNKGANAALKDTTDKAQRAGKQIQEAFNKIGSATVKVSKTIGKTALAVGTAWAATIESTRDYRTEMAKLDAAFTSNGHSAETATKTYKALQAVLGESDQSVEAANHLAKMCKNEEDLAKWTDICTGVFATFGDSLPIEGLTEAANETVKVGQVTGSLADALNWAGISEEDFNKRLKACRTEQERQTLIMNALNSKYKDSSERYKENAASIMRANEANDNLTRAMSRLGAVGEPIMSGIKNWIANMVNASVPYLEMVITKFGEINSVWNDVIWPLVQSAFKITFNVDVPDWSVIESTVKTWWNGTAIPALQNVFKVPFDITPPTWSAIPASISTWWAGTAKPKIEGITNAIMSISPPDLSVFMNSFTLDWEKLVAPALFGLLTGNYLTIVPVIGAALAGTIISNWDTHIKPALDEFLNQELDIKMPDWAKLKSDIQTNLQGLITPETKATLEEIGKGISDAFGTGGESVKIVFDSAKSFGEWCVQNKETVNEFFSTLAGEALGDTSGGISLINLMMTSIKGLAQLGVDTVTNLLQYMVNNGEAVATALEVVAVGFMVAAAAAHPYAAAIVAAAGALGYLTAKTNEMKSGEIFDKYTEEDLAILQEYVDAYNAAREAEREWEITGNDALVNTAYDAENLALARVKAIEGLYEDLETYQFKNGATYGDTYLDIPARLAEGTESEIQAELGRMALNAKVHLTPVYTGFQSATSRWFSSAYRIGGTSSVDGSHASGLDYVPRDGYFARLHKGEAILDSTSADAWRGGGSGKIEALLSQLVANTSVGPQIVLDNGILVGQISSQMDSKLGTISRRKGRGN